MRISDWSSDVCSSDLLEGVPLRDGAMVTVAAPNGNTSTPIIWNGSSDTGGANAGGLNVADAGLALDAAAAGFGHARVPALLAEADIASGRLVVVSGPEPVAATYWRSEEHTPETQSPM